LASQIQLQPFWTFHEFPGDADAAEGVADLGVIRRLMADGERGRNRIVRGGVEIDRHPRRQGVIGAPAAPGKAGPVLHRDRVGLRGMPQREVRQIPLQERHPLKWP